MQVKSEGRVGTFPSLSMPFIVRQFERAYTAELKIWILTGRLDKIRTVSCMEKRSYTIQDASMT